ncbi:hypothetical protein glysoja_020629 [Glycine soja]|nr:hypothetical protein glysoja_020629 [Glycine soja]
MESNAFSHNCCAATATLLGARYGSISIHLSHCSPTPREARVRLFGALSTAAAARMAHPPRVGPPFTRRCSRLLALGRIATHTMTLRVRLRVPASIIPLPSVLPLQG